MSGVKPGLNKHHYQPTCSPSRVHIFVYLGINLIGFFVVLLVCCPREETVLVIRILKLVGVNVGLFTTLCLGFCNDRGRGALASRSNI